MTELRDLYQEFILDHGRRPRNRRALESATHRACGHNPLCGDRITMALRVVDQRIEEIAFEGSGCAICLASASVMTQEVQGRSVAEYEELFRGFRAMLTADHETERVPEVGKLAAFAGVRRFPVRIKCATLAWHTVRAALDSRPEAVSTE